MMYSGRLKCPCGQTYGTCRKHEVERAVCTFSFEFKGELFSTYILRPKWATDEQWEEAKDYGAEQVSEKLRPARNAE